MNARRAPRPRGAVNVRAGDVSLTFRSVVAPAFLEAARAEVATARERVATIAERPDDVESRTTPKSYELYAAKRELIAARQLERQLREVDRTVQANGTAEVVGAETRLVALCVSVLRVVGAHLGQQRDGNMVEIDWLLSVARVARDGIVAVRLVDSPFHTATA